MQWNDSKYIELELELEIMHVIMRVKTLLGVLQRNIYQLSELSPLQVAEVGEAQPGPLPETGGLSKRGSYSYVGDDGNTYRVDYTAGERGFQPQAAHLPVAPAQIPEYDQLRREHPELFWAENGGAGLNQQKFGKNGDDFFF